MESRRVWARFTCVNVCCLGTISILDFSNLSNRFKQNVNCFLEVCYLFSRLLTNCKLTIILY